MLRARRTLGDLKQSLARRLLALETFPLTLRAKCPDQRQQPVQNPRVSSQSLADKAFGLVSVSSLAVPQEDQLALLLLPMTLLYTRLAPLYTTLAVHHKGQNEPGGGFCSPGSWGGENASPEETPLGAYAIKIACDRSGKRPRR